jgi:hypothetical protein
MGDIGEILCMAGTTKVEGGGREMGPGWAGCVCARCRDGGDVCSSRDGVSVWGEETNICDEWPCSGYIEEVEAVNETGALMA